MPSISCTTRIAFFIFFFLLSLFSPFLIRAQEASPAALPQPVDSYSLFWPLSAGRTEADSLYSLKLFKETVQEWFVFGDTKKVDYTILLGTKRVLEAEKLLTEGKNELATKALESAATRYIEAHELAKKAHGKGKFFPQEVRRDRLINVRRLIDYLKTGAPEEVDIKLEKVKDKANMLLSDFLAKSENRQFNI